MTETGPTAMAFPWAQAVGFGLGILRLSPAQFWAMTPRELSYAIAPFQSPHQGHERPGRADLARMMRAFPDEEPLS